MLISRFREVIITQGRVGHQKKVIGYVNHNQHSMLLELVREQTLYLTATIAGDRATRTSKTGIGMTKLLPSRTRLSLCQIAKMMKSYNADPPQPNSIIVARQDWKRGFGSILLCVVGNGFSLPVSMSNSEMSRLDAMASLRILVPPKI